MTLDELAPPPEALPPEAAEHHVEALLCEYRSLRALDGVRTTLDPAKLPSAERVHRALQAFAQTASSDADRLEQAMPPPAGLAELREAARVARALTARPPSLLKERWRRVDEGRTTLHSPDDARRVLGLSV